MVSPKMIYVPGDLSPLEGAVGIQPQGDDLPRTAAPPSIGECTIPSHGWFMTLLYPTLFEKPAIFRMLWRHVLVRSKRQTLASSCSWPLAMFRAPEEIRERSLMLHFGCFRSNNVWRRESTIPKWSKVATLLSPIAVVAIFPTRLLQGLGWKAGENGE